MVRAPVVTQEREGVEHVRHGKQKWKTPMCATIMSCLFYYPIPSQQTMRIYGAILQSGIADMLCDVGAS